MTSQLRRLEPLAGATLLLLSDGLRHPAGPVAHPAARELAERDGLEGVCGALHASRTTRLTHIGDLQTRADAGDTLWAATFGRCDQSRKSRKRGRGDVVV